MFNMKRMLSLILIGTMCVGALVGCGKKKEEEQTFELTPLTEDQLESGKYYVKNGDTFYALPSGTHTFDDDSALVPDGVTESDPSRVIWFGADDATIPTLYADDTLVYVTSTLPDSFVWERYKDNGYTVGVSGLEVNNTGSYQVDMDGIKFYPGSSMKNAIAESGAEAGDALVYDAIDDAKISSGNVSESGTILGLKADKTYNVDVYDGSKYIQLTDIKADTHAFGAYEVYTSSICNYMKANYIQVVVPDNFISGYYFINGTGFVRYVDNARSKGIADVDFNKAYYITDDEGQVHTIDELGEDGEVVVDEEKYYSTITNIDCTNNSMQIDIHYDDAKGTNVDGSEIVYDDEEVGLPKIKLIDPDGNDDYVFTNSETEENTLTITVQNPVPGAWETRVYNAEKRLFNVVTTFDSGHNNTLVHNGERGTITYYVPESMKNAQFTITWSNNTVSPKSDDGVVIKDNKVNDPKGEKETTYTRDSITVSNSDNYKEGRGEIRMVVGEIKYGEYTISVDAPYALGRVRVTAIDLASGDVEQAELEEVPADDTQETVEETNVKK